jgi:cell division septum initiation protein DivIVA
MSYTPVELRHVKLPRGFGRGYRRGPVDDLIADVIESFEAVWRERADLADRVETLEKQLEDLRSREQLLSTTLVSAEKAAADAKEHATREAELIVAEAHAEARSITRTALADRERLFAEARRVEALLRSALGMVEEAERADAAPVPEAAPDDESGEWPQRADTREFRGPALVVPAGEEVRAG